MSKASNGLFIAFEGGEGSGKTTQAELLAVALEFQGVPSHLTREPGDTPLGCQLRALLLDPSGNVPINRRAEALIFAADRAQHVEDVIRPELQRGKVVVCDRYIASSLAYQAHAGGLDRNMIAQISQWATNDLMKPDITFFLDITPAVGLERAMKVAATRFENHALEYHSDVRKGFLAEKDDSWVTLDGEDEPDVIHSKILSHVQHMLFVLDRYRFTSEDVEKTALFSGATTKPLAAMTLCVKDDCDNPYHQYGHCHVVTKAAEKPAFIAEELNDTDPVVDFGSTQHSTSPSNSQEESGTVISFADSSTPKAPKVTDIPC